jgi:nucleotide-binding universal stress UspA family protein
MRDDECPPKDVVLVALDGSPAAATALPIGCTIAAQLGARVEALYVLPPGLSPAEARARLGVHGIELRLESGDPADVILRVSEEPDVALIVFATHGHDVGGGGSLAGIPEQVASKTSQPVLLVRPETTRAEDVWRPLRRLLFPVDGTPTTTEAFAPAAELAARLGAEIDVLFVVHPNQAVPDERGTMLPPYYVDQPYHEWQAWQVRVTKWIRCHCDHLPRETIIHTYLVSARKRGEVGDAIARFAAERGEHAVILVRRSQMEHGRAPVLRALFERTPCPILLVAGPARPFTPDVANAQPAGSSGT